LSEEDVISSSRHAQLGGDKGGRAAGQSRAGSSCEAAVMCSHCADWHDAAFPPADKDGGLSGRAGGVGGRSEVCSMSAFEAMISSRSMGLFFWPLQMPHPMKTLVRGPDIASDESCERWCASSRSLFACNLIFIFFA